MKKILVVGAGFSGAVIARELAESGKFQVDVIDRRSHIGGNAYDELDEETGCRYHKYGPHIFHTNDLGIFEYLSKFTDWIPYKHKVEAHVEGVGDVPLPVNLDTLNKLYDENLESEAQVEYFLAQERTVILKPKNAWQHLISVYGKKITELFFSRYTEKMWDLTMEQLPASVVARIPIRKDNNPYYFNDKYQFMPKQGYKVLFDRLLDHELINVKLGVEFSKSMEGDYDHVFNGMPIDVYYDYCFGELPYRSIKFEHRISEEFPHSVPTVNFTNKEKYTRKTNWDLYPGCGGGSDHIVTYEEPCDYKDNDMERYYPIKTVDGEPQRIYTEYRDLAKGSNNLTFIGRCGQYVYYDMHQVVANSLKIAKQYISES